MKLISLNHMLIFRVLKLCFMCDYYNIYNSLSIKFIKLMLKIEPNTQVQHNNFYWE